MDGQNQNAAPAAAPAQPAQPAQIPPVPATWPGAFGVYKHSKQAVMGNLSTLVVLWLLSVIFDVTFNVVLPRSIITLVVANIVYPFLTVATVLALLASVRGQKASVGDALSKSLSLWLKSFATGLLVGLLLLASLVALLIPFFFILPRVVLAFYFLADKDMGPVQAVQASWDSTKGHSARVWGIIGVNILMVLLMVTIIGIPFALYFLLMYSAAMAVLYEFLGKNPPQAAAPAQSAPEPPAAAPQAPPASPPAA